MVLICIPSWVFSSTNADDYQHPHQLRQRQDRSHRSLIAAKDRLFCDLNVTSNHSPTVFWINMEEDKLRGQYMEQKLNYLGFKHERIEAITPKSTRFRLASLQKPCKRNTKKDISAILSHLTAIHRAVYSDRINEEQKSAIRMSDYALVIEDDVKFLFQLNYTALIVSAPKDFGNFYIFVYICVYAHGCVDRNVPICVLMNIDVCMYICKRI